MKILFDPTKDAANQDKHGVSLTLAESLEWDLLVAREDARTAYGEMRMQGFAPIGRKVYCVIYIDCDDAIRIVSLRQATPREVRSYARQI
jgi:uncharacterized protein